MWHINTNNDGVKSQYILLNDKDRYRVLLGTILYRIRQITTDYLKSKGMTVNNTISLGHLFANICHQFMVTGIAKKMKLELS